MLPAFSSFLTTDTPSRQSSIEPLHQIHHRLPIPCQHPSGMPALLLLPFSWVPTASLGILPAILSCLPRFPLFSLESALTPVHVNSLDVVNSRPCSGCWGERCVYLADRDGVKCEGLCTSGQRRLALLRLLALLLGSGCSLSCLPDHLFSCNVPSEVAPFLVRVLAYPLAVVLAPSTKGISDQTAACHSQTEELIVLGTWGGTGHGNQSERLERYYSG